MPALVRTLRDRNRRQATVIRVQWLIILALIVALAVALLAQRPAEAISPEPAITAALDPIVTIAPTPEPEPDPTPALVELGELKLTAYCPCEKCCGKDEADPYYGITASGARATANHTIAVDPRVIPMGSEVVINGRTYVAEDVGGAIKENRIDIYFDSHQEALTFGVQYATVYVSTNIL